MKRNSDGTIAVTVVDGTTFTGILAPNGSLNIISGHVGFGCYHPCGAIRVTQVDGLSPSGFYAADGSWNVIEGTTPNSASGASVIPVGSLVPNTAILTEASELIITEAGEFLIQE